MLSLEAALSAAASFRVLLLLLPSRRSGVWALIMAPDLYLILAVYMQQSSIFPPSQHFYCLFVCSTVWAGSKGDHRATTMILA